MNLLIRTRQWAGRGWRQVNPLYDEYACPACRALVSGDRDRRAHSEKHRQDAVYLEQLHHAVYTIARHAGLRVEFTDPGTAGEGYEYVSLRDDPPDYDDDDQAEEDDNE